jgi:hypothetical protein
MTSAIQMQAKAIVVVFSVLGFKAKTIESGEENCAFLV